MSGKDRRKRNVLDVDKKTDREGDDWMSGGNEFHSSDAATGNVRRPTVVSGNGGTSSWSDDDDRSDDMASQSPNFSTVLIRYLHSNRGRTYVQKASSDLLCEEKQRTVRLTLA